MTSSTSDFSRFAEALQGDDDLGVVVRGHIYIESKLNTYIQTLVPHPDELPNLRYYQKIELSCALGLSSAHAPLLKAIGDLRNSFAHNPDAQITVNSAAKLSGVFSDTDRKAAEVVVETFRVNGAELSGQVFRDLTPKDQFIVAAILLTGILERAITEARQSPDTPRQRKERILASLGDIVKRMT